MNLNLIIKKGHEGLKHLPYLIGFIVLVIITLGTFYRLQFGVDFRDEAYYLALAHSLNIGNIPFVSEYSLHQTSSWLTYPIVTILSYIIGTDGLVLAMRTLYLIFSLISGLFIGSIITGKKFSFLGCFIGSLLWLYWPFAIPNFSYNTLCSILFTLSIFSFLYSLELTKEKKNKFIILSAKLIKL